MNELANHVVDIDIYHTTRDKAAYCGGLFWFTDHYLDAATSTHRTYSHENAPDDGSPYGELMAVGGAAYLLAIVFMRWRS